MLLPTLARNARWLGAALLCLASLLTAPAQAERLCVEQADDRPFCLEHPAQRIVCLAPHLGEMLLALGAPLVGVVEGCDYPPEARALPRIGPYHSLDFERLLRLRPDLIVAWQSGTSAAQLARLHKLGLAVWVARSTRLADIPREWRALGRLSGREAQAETLAAGFERELGELAARHARVRKLSGFYEVWPQPLLTVSDAHFIGQAMAVCGIRNIVGVAMGDTPTWSEEAVLRARPELIITSAPARDFARWRRWPELPAVKNDALIVLPADLLLRPGPRLIEGIRALCAAADRHREDEP